MSGSPCDGVLAILRSACIEGLHQRAQAAAAVHGKTGAPSLALAAVAALRAARSGFDPGAVSQEQSAAEIGIGDPRSLPALLTAIRWARDALNEHELLVAYRWLWSTELRGETVRRIEDAWSATMTAVGLLRVAAQAPGPPEETFRIADLTIEAARRRVRTADKEIHLPDQQFHLLLFLAGEPGRARSRSETGLEVWGAADVGTHLNLTVARTNRKLGRAPSGHPYITTVRAFGHRFLTDAEATGRPATGAGTNSPTGHLVVDRRGRRVLIGTHEVHVTDTEYCLLEALERHTGVAVGRTALTHVIWATDDVGRALATHISRLSARLPGEHRYISAVRNVGYVFTQPGD